MVCGLVLVQGTGASASPGDQAVENRKSVCFLLGLKNGDVGGQADLSFKGTPALRSPGSSVFLISEVVYTSAAETFRWY